MLHTAPTRRKNWGVSSAARRMRRDRGQAVHLRRAFHASQVPMVMVDGQRRYLDANRGARLLCRLSLDEMLRRRIDHLTPREGQVRLRLLWTELITRGQVCGEHEIRFDDGSRIQIVFSALANALPGEHLIVFAPARWPDDELVAYEEPEGQGGMGVLSDREAAIIGLIADGLSLAEIAERLRISLATVRTHAGNAYRKLGARNRPHAVALALRRGLIGASAEHVAREGTGGVTMRSRAGRDLHE